MEIPILFEYNLIPALHQTNDEIDINSRHHIFVNTNQFRRKQLNKSNIIIY